MDLLTHALLGAAVAHAAAPREGAGPRRRERLLLGAGAAAFPDIDFVGFLLAPLPFLADWHQGPTHSLVLLPLWAALIATAFVRVGRRGLAWGEAGALSALALASHIAADLITVYGTMLLFPLSRWRPSLGTTFLVDPLFTGIVAAGLALGLAGRRRWPTRAALALLCAYVAGQGALRERALALGHELARAQGFGADRLSALPQPFSPFNWKLIASNETLHRQAYLNVAGHGPLRPLPRPLQEMAAAYAPPGPWLSWQTRQRWGDAAHRPMVEALWRDPRFAPFRRFAAHPAVSAIERRDSETCVWFTDLRYDLPVLPDTFRYGFCRGSADPDWRLYRLRYFSRADRQPL